MARKAARRGSRKSLKRIHEKLRNKAELLKLHLKHHHMPTEQFKKRTSQLKIPKEIVDLYDQVVKECEPCCKNRKKPSRSRVSGLRSEVFGELTFMDHCEIKMKKRKSLSGTDHL